jgi:hypothetical protein
LSTSRRRQKLRTVTQKPPRTPREEHITARPCRKVTKTNNSITTAATTLTRVPVKNKELKANT